MDNPSPEYLAFISYRHADNTAEDRQWATWLHQQLEVYDIPADLIGTANLRGETIPERIYPVFRDEVSLPAHADLSTAITYALDRSRFLIVLCSPRAVQSRYVNEEILHFKRTGKQDRIMAALVLGEPNVSIDDAKLEDPEDARTLECFPKALQYHLKADGDLDTTQATEPIAANFRLPGGGKGLTNPQVYKQQLLEQGHRKADAERLADAYEEQLNTAKLKIIAGILGVRLEQLVQRDKIHQLNKARAASRRLMRIAALMSVLAFVAVIGGGLAYQQWQRAEQEKNRAEELLGQMRTHLSFMNIDLRDVMKGYVPQDRRIPIMQRIDTMVEALQQSGGQTTADQWQIAIALAQKADLIVNNSALDPAEALLLYEQAEGIFQALVAQDPTNTGFQRDLSVSQDRLGDIRLRLGETAAALGYHEAGLTITQALVTQDPTNTKFLRDLSMLQDKLGDIRLRLGETWRRHWGITRRV
jgi:tetratricopeptide (TPR) repeat protein